MARPALRIKVAEEDQKNLRNLLRGGIQQVRVTLRADVAAACGGHDRAANSQLAGAYTPIRSKIAHRYSAGGLALALYDRQRPGAAELLDDIEKQRIVAMVCSPPPEGQARWAVRLVTEHAVKRKLVPSSRPGNDSRTPPKPRFETVAGKNVGSAQESEGHHISRDSVAVVAPAQAVEFWLRAVGAVKNIVEIRVLWGFWRYREVVIGREFRDIHRGCENRAASG